MSLSAAAAAGTSVSANANAFRQAKVWASETVCVLPNPICLFGCFVSANCQEMSPFSASCWLVSFYLRFIFLPFTWALFLPVHFWYSSLSTCTLQKQKKLVVSGQGAWVHTVHSNLSWSWTLLQPKSVCIYLLFYCKNLVICYNLISHDCTWNLALSSLASVGTTSAAFPSNLASWPIG